MGNYFVRHTKDKNPRWWRAMLEERADAPLKPVVSWCVAFIIHKANAALAAVDPNEEFSD